MKQLARCAAGLVFGLMSLAAQAEVTLSAGYLKQGIEAPAVLSNLDPVPETQGVDGAQLGLADNQSSGRFLGHAYALEVAEITPRVTRHEERYADQQQRHRRPAGEGCVEDARVVELVAQHQVAGPGPR